MRSGSSIDRTAAGQVPTHVHLYTRRRQDGPLDTGYLDATGGNHKSIVLDSALLFRAGRLPVPAEPPVIGARGGPGEPGCGSLPDVAANWLVRQLITNTGWGTGLDIRPNPGIGFPGYADCSGHPGGPRSAERPLSRRAAPGPIPYLGARRTEPQLSRPRWDTAVARLPPARRPARRASLDHRRRARNRSWCRCPLSCNRHPHRRRRCRAPRRHEAGMKENLGGAIARRRLSGRLRAGPGGHAGGLRPTALRDRRPTRPEFHTVSGLENGSFVRIAGVEVGKVRTIRIRDDGIALVEFGADASVVLTEGSRAVIRYRNLIGERYLALEGRRVGGTRRLPVPAPPFRSPAPPRHWTSTLSSAASALCSTR